MTAIERREGSGLRSGLRTQLVAHALFSVLLPIAILGGAAFFVLTYHLDIVASSFDRSRGELTDNVARTDLVAQAKGVTRQIDAFFTERIVEGKAWASAKVVVAAALAAHERHVEEGLIDAPVAAIEERFRDEKSLNVSPEADAYLRNRVAASPHFAEIFFTEPTNALRSIEDALHDWRATLALALVAMAVLSGAFAVILAIAAARGAMRPPCTRSAAWPSVRPGESRSTRPRSSIPRRSSA